jgi:predicted DCC family thiol-disulfide oxidoreductase YuxK
VTKPVLIFDGNCEFCLRWVKRWRAHTGDQVRYAAVHDPNLREVLLVMPDGTTYRGADAVFRALEYAPSLRPLARIGQLPLVRNVARVCYRFIAGHRPAAARLDRWLFRHSRDEGGHAGL